MLLVPNSDLIRYNEDRKRRRMERMPRLAPWWHSHHNKCTFYQGIQSEKPAPNCSKVALICKSDLFWTKDQFDLTPELVYPSARWRLAIRLTCLVDVWLLAPLSSHQPRRSSSPSRQAGPAWVLNYTADSYVCQHNLAGHQQQQCSGVHRPKGNKK